MSFDPTKPVQTRDGCEAEILKVYKPEETDYPIIGAIKYCGRWMATAWKLSGRFLNDGETHPRDLVNAPIKRTVYVNMYAGRIAYYYPTEEEAQLKRGHCNAVAVAVPATFTEGQGL